VTASRLVAGCFVASVVASVALVVTYLVGGQVQVEGVLLAIALGALGIGVVVWAVALMDASIETEERHPLASAEPERVAVAEAADIQSITRRSFLVRLLIGAGAVLAGALALPAFSLGPTPGQALFRTAWRPGARVVTSDGTPIRPADLTMGSIQTVFPENAIGSADAATLLIRVRPSDLELDAERVAWAPDGAIGFSKICTHAGCPVGLFRAEEAALLCPCHQSTFDVRRGAVPVFGPAVRPLPQLPMSVDEEGYLVALDDFPEPVGPSFWNMTHENGPALVDDADPNEGA
jgi:ubiquinol-cytochrome c reductase iron-sulfur subunit